jgi:hypothetical protein
LQRYCNSIAIALQRHCILKEELDADAGIRYNSSLDAMHFGLCKKLVQYLTNNT